MTLHLAAALLIFSIVQLWATAAAIEAGGPRWMPLVGLAILLLGAIPLVRALELRWTRLDEAAVPDAELTALYRRDRGFVWTAALIAPMLWVLTIAQWS